MKTDIYYFSGTGNSLFIAEKLNSTIENSNLFSIPKIINNEGGITGEVIGVVCPIYMYNIPHIVADFIKKIESAEYFFLVFAGAGQFGYGIKKLKKLFKSCKIDLSAVFNVAMPSNYTPYGATPEEKQKELFSNVENEVKEIVSMVMERKNYLPAPTNSFYEKYIHPGLLYRLGHKYINSMDRSFAVEESCGGCGICEKVCPVNNVTVVDKKPVWHSNCQQCYACLQWCPTESIQYGKNTAGIKRYHNPFVKVQQIINSRARVE